MVGILEIGCYFPERRESNLDLAEKFDVTEEFIKGKIGVSERSVKAATETVLDMCGKAFANLIEKADVSPDAIGCCVVVTQNPGLPHASAVLHGMLDLPESCAAFDISLGCSGYVYALSVMSSFMQQQGIEYGLLCTADPYSTIVDPEDKATALLFGDAATATLLKRDAGLVPVGFDFGTLGKEYMSLARVDGTLSMNGRQVFNFAAKAIPPSVERLLNRLAIPREAIRDWYFHQGSRYIVDTIMKRLGLSEEKMIFDIDGYGNTVSSSIPVLLATRLKAVAPGDLVFMSGFGVGLSWGSAVLKKV